MARGYTSAKRFDPYRVLRERHHEIIKEKQTIASLCCRHKTGKREKGFEREEKGSFLFLLSRFASPTPSKFSSRHRKRSAFAWEITRTILKVLKGKMRNTMLSSLRASRDIFHYLRKLSGQRVDLTKDIEPCF